MADRHPMAVVIWSDAVKRDDGFMAPFETRTERRSVGWVLRDDKHGVVLAMDDGGAEYGYEFGLGIPRIYVSSVRYLRRLEKDAKP